VDHSIIFHTSILSIIKRDYLYSCETTKRKTGLQTKPEKLTITGTQSKRKAEDHTIVRNYNQLISIIIGEKMKTTRNNGIYRHEP